MLTITVDRWKIARRYVHSRHQAPCLPVPEYNMVSRPNALAVSYHSTIYYVYRRGICSGVDNEGSAITITQPKLRLLKRHNASSKRTATSEAQTPASPIISLAQVLFRCGENVWYCTVVWTNAKLFDFDFEVGVTIKNVHMLFLSATFLILCSEGVRRCRCVKMMQCDLYPCGVAHISFTRLERIEFVHELFAGINKAVHHLAIPLVSGAAYDSSLRFILLPHFMT